MAVTAKVYGRANLNALNGKMNLTTDTIKVMLLTSAYTPDQDVHEFVSSIRASEVAGTGYTAGGYTLANKTLTYDPTLNKVTFDNTVDPTWAASTITARYAVFYDDTPATDATKPLISYVDFGADQISASGTFTITLDALGIFATTAA